MVNPKADSLYSEGCPRGWFGVWWVFRAILAEQLMGLVLAIAPDNYVGSWFGRTAVEKCNERRMEEVAPFINETLSGEKHDA